MTELEPRLAGCVNMRASVEDALDIWDGTIGAVGPHRVLCRTRAGGGTARTPCATRPARLRARAFCVARDRPLGVRKAKKGTSGQRQWHTSWFGEVAAGAGCASTRDDWSVSRRSDSRHDLHGSRSAADRLPPRWSIRAGGRRHRRRLVKDLGRRRPHNPDFLASCVNFFFFLLLLYVHDLRRYTVSYLSYLSRHRAAGRRDPPSWPAARVRARPRGCWRGRAVAARRQAGAYMRNS